MKDQYPNTDSTAHNEQPQSNTCSDCGNTLDTYQDKHITIGTCRNHHCRLYHVTYSIDALAAFTETERNGWAAVNYRQRRAAQEKAQRDAQANEERLKKYPPHLRKYITGDQS